MFHVPNKYRIINGILASDESFGNNGAFFIPINNNTINALCLASDGKGWEHVSVTLFNKKNNSIKRCPTWDEMCYIKNAFWDETDCTLQFHPPASQYINNQLYCLHIWRPIGSEILIPPSIL